MSQAIVASVLQSLELLRLCLILFGKNAIVFAKASYWASTIYSDTLQNVALAT